MKTCWAVVVQAFNLSIQEAKAGRSLSLKASQSCIMKFCLQN